MHSLFAWRFESCSLDKLLGKNASSRDNSNHFSPQWETHGFIKKDLKWEFGVESDRVAQSNWNTTQDRSEIIKDFESEQDYFVENLKSDSENSFTNFCLQVQGKPKQINKKAWWRFIANMLLCTFLREPISGQDDNLYD